tara:strand:+ start:279 stop:821 length:543 start_codon:yes stop_codon:yes gene_type:complete
MSSFELNKIIGAILLAILVMVVIGKIGDNLVSIDDHHDSKTPEQIPTVVASATKPPPKKKKIEPIADLLATASVKKGKKVFAKCKGCHSVEKGGRNGIGPNLWGIVNRNPGKVSGFKYSIALKSIDTKPWNYGNLNLFLAKPKNYAKGTKMSFVGLKKTKDRANVISYLRSLSDNPAPLK